MNIAAERTLFEGRETDSLTNNQSRAVCISIHAVMVIRLLMQMCYIAAGIYLYIQSYGATCFNRLEYIPLLIAFASFIKMYTLWYETSAIRQRGEDCGSRTNSIIKFINRIMFWFFIGYWAFLMPDNGCSGLQGADVFLQVYLGVEYLGVLVIVLVFVGLLVCGMRIFVPHIFIGTLENMPFRTGVSDDFLDRMPIYGYSIRGIQSMLVNRGDPSDVIPIDADSTTCAICLEPYADDCSMRYLLCRHHYHKHCCDEWLKIHRSCPLCRAEVAA